MNKVVVSLTDAISSFPEPFIFATKNVVFTIPYFSLFVSCQCMRQESAVWSVIPDFDVTHTSEDLVFGTGYLLFP